MSKTLLYGEKVLDKTPDMLRELKEAKVVDAGGKGLLLLLSGFAEVVKNPNIEYSFSEKETMVPVEKKRLDDKTQDIEFMYCTELFITGKNIDMETLKIELSNFGDSMIVVGNDKLVNLHTHK